MKRTILYIFIVIYILFCTFMVIIKINRDKCDKQYQESTQLSYNESHITSYEPIMKYNWQSKMKIETDVDNISINTNTNTNANTNTDIDSDADAEINPAEQETDINDIEDEQINNVDADIVEQEIYTDDVERWWTDYDLDLLAAVIYYEAGSDECTDRHQQLVAQVVINRKNSSEFPDTIYDIITQRNQYSTCDNVLSSAGNKDLIPQRCYDNAIEVLNGNVECPDNVVWQANFLQGSGVYEEIYTSYSVSYFCYR